jgi:predicted dehydrogenase
MKVLILGSGMYVTGKDHSKTGTILSSVLQASKTLPIYEVKIVSYAKGSIEHTLASANYTNKLLGTEVSVTFDSLEDKEADWLANFIKAEKFNFCVNSLPDHLHFQFGKLTLENQLPTLMVKPLTPTYKEGLELQKIAKETNTYCAVEFHKRWDESNLYLKNSIEQNRLGDMLYFDVNYSQRVVIPSVQFKSWAAQTNIFQYLGVHYVDLIYFMTGKTPKYLSVYGTKKKLVRLGIDTWDSVHVSSVWGNPNDDQEDFYAHFNLNWIDPNNTTAMSDQRISAVGTEGRIDCDQKNRGIQEVTSAAGAQSINPYFSSWIAGEDGLQHLNGYGFKSIFAFVSDIYSLQNNKTTIAKLNQIRPGIEQSLVSTKFIDAVTQQLIKNNTSQIAI